jgi:hypothetical protein
MDMVVEKGNAAGLPGLFQVLVSYSQFCYCVLFIISMKMIVNGCGSSVNYLNIVRKLH